jgi:hypothetical protein
MIYMTRMTFLLDLYDEETIKSLYYSALGEPLKGREKEYKECNEKLDVITQMLNELPTDNLVGNGEESGIAKQEFMGVINGEPELYYNSNDAANRYYYVTLSLKDSLEDDTFGDKRLLRLSYKIWVDWFTSGHYQKERLERAIKKQSTYVRLFMLNGEVTELEWLDA